MSVFAPTVGLLTAALILSSPEPLSIRVVNPAVLAGQAIRIYCFVEHAPQNRVLTLAVEGYRTSTWELEGEDAPRVYERLFEHMPCGVDTVSCTLTTEMGRQHRVARPIHVTGCEQ